MPRLRESTISAHRSAVRDAVIGATAELVARNGLRAVTMSQVAARSGIGRATLYRYFSDVDQILLAWHERQLRGHLDQLVALRHGPGPAGDRLAAVLAVFASIRHAHRGAQDAALLHGGSHVRQAYEHVRELVEALIDEAARSGRVRDDVPPAELGAYCLAAVGAAAALPSQAAVDRLVEVTLAGLRPST